jgi:hypothetical protein
VPIVLKSESLNLLETSGPVQAGNGNALPLPDITDISTPQLFKIKQGEKQANSCNNTDYEILVL